ncbi:MAG: hypothetical protein ACSLEW_07005 [Nocardioides sp.]
MLQCLDFVRGDRWICGNDRWTALRRSQGGCLLAEVPLVYESRQHTREVIGGGSFTEVLENVGNG